MDDEELLKMAEALEEVEDLTASDRKFVEKVLEYLREEKRLTKKDKQVLMDLYKEHVKDGDDGDPNEDIDEDDFV
jgi:hypothetical protein